MKFERLGWIVAAGLAGSMVGMGFQGATQKIGTVDMSKVFGDSALVKKQSEQLRTYQMARKSALEFLDQNRTLTLDEASKYATLAVKDSPTAADKTELDRLTGVANEGRGKLTALQTKVTPTAEDTKQLQDYTARSSQIQQLLQDLAGRFDQEVRTYQDKLRSDTLDKVRDAVKQVSSKQGYTVVFANEVAPYAANDITKEALDAMNKANK